MTEQELRKEFEKIKNEYGCIGLLNNEFKWFQKGYSLAQETIEKQKKEIETLDSIIKYQLYQLKAKDAEIERLSNSLAKNGLEKINLMNKSEQKNKAIAWARELFLNHIAIFESQGLQWCCENDIQEAKAWLESNK